MLTRAAVATVLICIVILLCSACGLPLLLDRPSPSVQREDFVLWQTAPDQSQHVVGYGSINGTLDEVDATAYLFPSSCSPETRVNLRGRPKPKGQSATVTLQSDNFSVEAEDVALTLHQAAHDQWIAALPFLLTYQSAGCPGSPVIQVEAREGPLYRSSWRGVGDPTGIIITLNQSQPNSANTAKLWGRVYEFRGVCHGSGTFSSDIPTHSRPASHTTDFDMGDHALLRIDGLPSTLNEPPPGELHLHLTFVGGPCDGQSFDALATTSPSY